MGAFQKLQNSIQIRISYFFKETENLTLSQSSNTFAMAGFVRVLENLESPGILLWHFPGLESPGKSLLVLESSGNLFNSSKKI